MQHPGHLQTFYWFYYCLLESVLRAGHGGSMVDTALLTTEAVAPVRGWPWWGMQGPLTDQG